MGSTLRDVRLADKYEVSAGTVFLNGVQALVRLPLLQQQRDQEQGLNTAGFITGYRGSPLGAYDAELLRQKKILDAHNVTFQPGVNEDLAATAVHGSQQLISVGDAKYDGVFSIWYAKGPGVDRSGDAFKHGNVAGVHPNGGVLVVYGDDHPGKSSTVAHQSEQALAANLIPSLYPSNVAEFFAFGLFGWALSRYAGTWVGFKTVNETAEQTATVDLDLDAIKFVSPDPATQPAEGVHYRGGPYNPARDEEILVNYRIPLVHQFVRANGLDRVTQDSKQRRLGVVTAGKSWLDVLRALELLGINSDKADALGIGIYKVGCIWPLEPVGIARFARGQAELFVVEEKKAFLEQQIATVLFNVPERPRLVGKVDELGEPLLSQTAVLDPRDIAAAIYRRLLNLGVDVGDLRLPADASEPGTGSADTEKRAPFFCSGCPHSTSTRVPEGSHMLAGIGCHTMAALVRPNSLLPTQMGGEGANWIGLSPFTKTEHVFQNLGDGTYYHSGLLAIRAAVASGINITYKILYNDAVAMTGGQSHDGPLSVFDVLGQVVAEGVRRCVVVSDEPATYRGDGRVPHGVEVFHRDELDAVQRSLRETEGCTVLVYEQTCAAEKRRRRKKGRFPDPAKRMFINSAVCEGCGDCSEQSTCVSLQPVNTSLGRKRQIDQSSCNKDYSCVKGFCPSFVTVYDAPV
jgi:indolepyruvate ferredoxin oxidoreductase